LKLDFFIKIKAKIFEFFIKKYSKITHPLIHDGQWTATLKPNGHPKRMFNSDVTLKFTLFVLNLVLKLQSYFKKKFKKKLLLEKFLKLHLSSFLRKLKMNSRKTLNKKFILEYFKESKNIHGKNDLCDFDKLHL